MHMQEGQERREKEKRHGRQKKGKTESNEGEALNFITVFLLNVNPTLTTKI